MRFRAVYQLALMHRRRENVAFCKTHVILLWAMRCNENAVKYNYYIAIAVKMNASIAGCRCW